MRGVRGGVLLLAALGAGGFAPPLAAQVTRGAWVEAVGLVTHQPRWTGEPATHVRIGMGGRDVGYTAELGSRITGPLGVAFSVHVTPTRQFWWQGARVTRNYGWEQAAAAAGEVYSTPLTWSCTSLSAVLMTSERLAGSGGVGLCGMSGIDYLWWGAGPMFSEAIHLAGRGYQPLAPGMDLALRCDAYRVNFANPRFTVVKIWAGEDAASYTQGDVTPVSCGLGLRWRVGTEGTRAAPVAFVAEAGPGAFLRSRAGRLSTTFAAMLAVGTTIPVGDDDAVTVRIRAASARFTERERAGSPHDGGFHQMTFTGEYSTAAVAGRIRLSGQLGAWTAGARDWELWRAGLAAGPLVGAGLELPFLHVGGGSAALTCYSQVLLGGAPAPLVLPCGVGGSIRLR